MKKKFVSYYLQLYIATVIFVNPIIGKQITKQTNLPTKTQPVPTQPITPIKPTSTPKASTGHTKNDPEVLDINKSVKIINNQHDCNANNWNNNPDEACQCCLTYGEGRFGEEQTADQIIDHCVNTSKQCSPSSITNIKRKYNAQNMSSDDFLNTLYDNTTVVHKMAVNPTSIKSDGTLTEDGLAEILSQAYAEGKLKDKHLSNKQCLNVEDLGSGSGFGTLQLFKVSSTCTSTEPTLYFVKESKKGLKESIHLKVVEEHPGMKELMAPNRVKNFPTIALPLFYFSYHPLHQKVHYIAAMPGAHGVVLCKLLTQFRDNQSTENAEELKTAYDILGKELSNFYKRFMTPTPGRIIGRTVAHGDFHCNNIFYDKNTGHCTFIDIETMIRSFNKPQSPKADFMRLIFPPFSTTQTLYNFNELITGIKPETYFNLTLKPFIQGYISTYNSQDQRKVLSELKEMFTTKIGVTFLDFNQKYMQNLVNKNIIPIFNDIEKSLQK